jgi:hypothetical protein
MNDQRLVQLERDLTATTQQLADLVEQHETTQRELAVAEDRVRAERKEADKVRRELARVRAEAARLKRERDPDYDPRDGDPSLQKGVGAIPLGQHEAMAEIEAWERDLGMSPTMDELRPRGGIFAEPPSAPMLQPAVVHSDAAATAAAVERAAMLILARELLARFAVVIADRDRWEPDDYNDARVMVWMLAAIHGATYFRATRARRASRDMRDRCIKELRDIDRLKGELRMEAQR